jgi:hypothetical protein
MPNAAKRSYAKHDGQLLVGAVDCQESAVVLAERGCE